MSMLPYVDVMLPYVDVKHPVEWVPELVKALQHLREQGPELAQQGICANVDFQFREGELDGYDMCEAVFKAMGYVNPTWPLGHRWADPDNNCWTGHYGERRMALVDEMLAFLKSYMGE